MQFRRASWLLPAAFAVHVLEEAPGFTAWAQRHASPRYSPRDFWRNNALGFALTSGATLAVARTSNRTVLSVYYGAVLTPQALVNTILHAGPTVAWRTYSPALLVVGVLSGVALVLGRGSPLGGLPNSDRLLITGLLVGACVTLIAISPLGRLSGAHINPAVTLAFWAMRRVCVHDLIGYVAA